LAKLVRKGEGLLNEVGSKNHIKAQEPMKNRGLPKKWAGACR